VADGMESFDVTDIVDEMTESADEVMKNGRDDKEVLSY
jgi:hypothetical protein